LTKPFSSNLSKKSFSLIFKYFKIVFFPSSLKKIFLFDFVFEQKISNSSFSNNSLILAQQNAGNIEVLKGRIDGFDGVKEKVDTMQQSIDSMQVQIDGLVQQQADYAQELAGPTPPDVTGTDYETTENVEDSMEEKN